MFFFNIRLIALLIIQVNLILSVFGMENNLQEIVPLITAGKFSELDKSLSIKSYNLNETVNQQSETVMHLAAKHDNMEAALAMVTILANHGCDVNKFDINWNTPLSLATFNANYEVIDFLFKKGARKHGDVSCRTCNPFFQALTINGKTNNKCALVKKLIDSGIAVNKRDIKIAQDALGECETQLKIATQKNQNIDNLAMTLSEIKRSVELLKQAYKPKKNKAKNSKSEENIELVVFLDDND